MFQITASGTLKSDIKKVPLCIRSTGEMIDGYACFMDVQDVTTDMPVQIIVCRSKPSQTLLRLAKDNQIIVTGIPYLYGDSVQIRVQNLSVSKQSTKVLSSIGEGPEVILNDESFS